MNVEIAAAKNTSDRSTVLRSSLGLAMYRWKKRNSVIPSNTNPKASKIHRSGVTSRPLKEKSYGGEANKNNKNTSAFPTRTTTGILSSDRNRLVPGSDLASMEMPLFSKFLIVSVPQHPEPRRCAGFFAA